MNIEFLLVFIIPLAILITFSFAGTILYLFPPKKINSIYGYRTHRSMKNQTNWDYAQKLGGKFIIVFGLIIFTIQTILGYFFSNRNLEQSLVIPIQLIILVLLLIIKLIVCEKQIEKFEANH